MSKTYLRGDLYYADLGHGIGSEQKGTRPVVIIQNNVGNKHSPTVIIAAVTSKANVKAKLPTHYYLDAGMGWYSRPSFCWSKFVLWTSGGCLATSADWTRNISGASTTLWQSVSA